MCSTKKLLLAACWCIANTMQKIIIVSAYGPYPYPQLGYYPSYPGPIYGSAMYPPPFYASPYASCYPPSCYTSAPSLPQPQNCGYQKPKFVKPLRIPSNSPLILPGQGGYSNTPIIISSKPDRPPAPSLLSPLTNLINSFLRGIISPRSSCGCDYNC